MNRSEIAAQYREDWARNRQRYTMQQVLEWEIKNDCKLLPWQRVFLLHTLNGGVVATTGKQWGVSTVKRAAQGIRADTMILDETHFMTSEEVMALGESHVQAHKDKVAGMSSADRAWDDIDRTIAADLSSHAMYRTRAFNVLPQEISELRHFIPRDDANVQRAIDYIKERYGATSIEWEGYPVSQDNKGLFQMQPGTFMQGRKNGKSAIVEGREPLLRHDLEQRITNQRKELKRLNACMKLQSAQAIQQNKRYDIRGRRLEQLEDREARTALEISHERALSAYWHAKYKELKKIKKGKKK